MRGDFSSSWNKEKAQNFRGTLHQQGRVMTDRDGNALTEFFNEWQQVAGQDIIGAGVAAIPADASDSFKVTNAAIQTDPDRIELNINGGRVWADGLVIDLESNVVREATYLEPPIQNPKGSIPDNPPNSPILRDAVILEAWLEELSAFQLPNLLIEPALGGVDTTERVNTAFRFRLYRMDQNDTCDSIIGQLDDDFGSKGKLNVTLQPDNTSDEDCPVNAEGGYVGFEHQLYRLEVAQTNQADSFIKWSQFNGGLVGRGTYVSAGNKINITANNNAIIHSGLTDTYLEAVKFDEEEGFWKVVYGGKAKLNISEQSLELSTVATDVFLDSLEISDNENIFFRLWNGIFPVSDFAEAAELKDGIHLMFDEAGTYTPHDYWKFEVRAGAVENNQLEDIAGVPTLINNLPPYGIFYHRVPLAELNWVDDEIDFESGDIEDCRRIFQPLTKLSTCCTYRVGNGTSSHGDFTSIQKAIKSLPLRGGQICVLPGEYTENIVIDEPRNRGIHIKGCGNRTRIVAERNAPVIHIKGGKNIKIESLLVSAFDDEEGVGILLEGDEQVVNREDRENKFGLLRNITLNDLQIISSLRSAIEMHVGQFVSITNCNIFCEDKGGDRAAVYLAGDDLVFEDNEIRVITGNRNESENDIIRTKIGNQKNIFDLKTNDFLEYSPASNSLGGLQLSGGCERVRVVNNLIIGGTGNGINLGSVDVEIDRAVTVLHRPWYKKRDKCDPKPDFIDIVIIDENTRLIAGAPLRDILIERNRIYSMGRNGIGVEAFFVVETGGITNRRGSKIEFISVENLVIIGNRIEFCLNRTPSEISDKLTNFIGYGGIALSVVEKLVIRDNFIRDNGANFLNAACGIFVLIGEAIEISRNHILNNGRRTDEVSVNKTTRNGARGGIFIFFATEGAKSFPATIQSNRFQKLSRRYPSGIPALKLHENIVSVPIGRALTIMSTGNVSITDNNFLSQSIAPVQNAIDFFASLVLIVSFNTSPKVAKQPAGYKNVNDGKYKARMQSQPAQSQQGTSTNTGAAPNAASNAALEALGRNFLSGGIHFADNQCELINLGRDNEFSALSAISILSLDDVGFFSNQVHCSLINSRMITDTFIFGLMVRASDNSWQEDGRSVFLSALTLGFLNTTTDNHSTHCLLARGLLYLDRHNLTLVDLAFGYIGNVSKIDNVNPCEALLQRLFALFGQKKTIGGQTTTTKTVATQPSPNQPNF